MEVAKCVPIYLLFLSIIFNFEVNGEVRDNYLTQRKLILEKEWSMWTGGNLKLTPKEQAVNKILMEFKAQEFAAARQTNGVFPPEIHFFHAKPLIEKSSVFKMIKSMPKGAYYTCTTYLQKLCCA